MRTSEIRVGASYAATGRDLQLARVQVLERSRLSRESSAEWICLIEEGAVYTGWSRNGNGALDMDYDGPGARVHLGSRDILRPWDEEVRRRDAVMNQRDAIRAAMSEMDDLLTDLGLPDAQMQLVQHPGGYMAVAVLGIEDLRRVRDEQERGRRAREAAPLDVGEVAVQPEAGQPRPGLPAPPAGR